ncbi:uncharacterized protein LOC110690689 isoform X2 [Chenopodium quinoa]|uniref:uncharacterized protein LOC110690689 isoform X2 n=1 Tax=Chenopodium quinoa TaxID=63459 RepID=UPI000B789D58|nr:uncharacterized protein LOC110690689 isoform X2 [Chenopodium quinoa]
MMKLKCGSNFFNGVQALNFIHGFHRLRYSTSCSSSTEANPSSSLTNYLVEVLGFSSQQSLSTSTKLAQRPKSAKATNDPESFVVSPLLFKDDLIKAEQKFRISRDSTMFLYVVRILRRLSEKNIESKFQVYKSFGWTQSDFFELIRRIPSCLGYSEAMTKMKLSFFMCELGYQPAYLMSRSAFMTCSLEKRVKPRHQVVLVLKEKGLIKKNYCFYSIIWMNELKFVNNLVLPYVEVHEIYANHVGVNAKLLTQGKANPHFNI